MIIGMRLSVGSQGAGLSGAAASLAWRYAAERRQGGKADAPPSPSIAMAMCSACCSASPPAPK
jgi:alkylation response protein AidB-like acyl-CoA dehydrogenase